MPQLKGDSIFVDKGLTRVGVADFSHMTYTEEIFSDL